MGEEMGKINEEKEKVHTIWPAVADEFGEREAVLVWIKLLIIPHENN